MKHHFFSEQIHLLRFIGKWLIFTAAVGFLTGSASAFLLLSLEWVTSTRAEHRWLIWLLPCAGFIVGWLYLRFGRQVEAGNNLLIDEIHDPKKIIPLRMAPLVMGGTIISHLFGASVGREGTAVQMGGAIADQFTKLINLSRDDRRIILLSGISAGFASIFGTPLAGAIFGLEVITIGRLRYDSILPCMSAAIIADRVGLWWGAQHTHYVIQTIPEIGLWPIIVMITTGAIFGLTGKIFADLTHALGGFTKKKIPYGPARPLIGGVLIAALAWWFNADRYLGLGIPTIVEAFNQHLVPYNFAVKLAYTVGSLGSGFKGGEVTPLFYIGATLGNTLAPIFHMPISFLAGIGFVAVFAGAANTPIASTLMAMELFGSEVGLYAAIACVVSYQFSGHSGIYQSQILGHAKNRNVIQEGLKLSELHVQRRRPTGNE